MTARLLTWAAWVALLAYEVHDLTAHGHPGLALMALWLTAPVTHALIDDLLEGDRP